MKISQVLSYSGPRDCILDDIQTYLPHDLWKEQNYQESLEHQNHIDYILEAYNKFYLYVDKIQNRLIQLNKNNIPILFVINKIKYLNIY